MSESSKKTLQNAKTQLLVKLGVLIALILAAVAGYMRFGDALSLEFLISKEEALQKFKLDHPWQLAGIAPQVKGIGPPG